MTAPVIQLVGAGKEYTKYEDNPMLVTAAFRLRRGTRRSKIWAVRDVNLEVGAGECVGVIGRNGSGKSTMLQMLAGVTAPSEGRVAVRGRIAPLISVGVGFHPELTGRENVYVNGTILGMTRAEIDRKYDEIVAFSEVEEFINTPIKFYSSGMLVRLGFAVAIQAEPDVLLIDEVLAVGDIAFQMKCFARITDIRHSGTTVLVVSHNLNSVRQLCDRVLVLHNGAARFLGPTPEALSEYHKAIDENREPEEMGLADNEDRVMPGVAEIRQFDLLGENDVPTAHLSQGRPVVFRIRARFLEAVENPSFGILLTTAAGVPVYYENSGRSSAGRVGPGDVECRIELASPLTTGTFMATAALRSTEPSARLSRTEPLSFYVDGRPFVSGVADLGARFDLAAGGEARP